MSRRSNNQTEVKRDFLTRFEMAIVGLKDQYRLDGASINYAIWKARMTFLLDDNGMKTYVDNVVAVPQDVDQ